MPQTFDVLDADTSVLLNFDGYTGEIVPVETWKAAAIVQQAYTQATGRAARIDIHGAPRAWHVAVERTRREAVRLAHLVECAR